MYFRKTEAIYFCAKGWTGQIRLKWLGKIGVLAQAVYAIKRCTSADSLEYVNSASWVARVTPTYVNRTQSSIGSPWRPSKPNPAIATHGNSSPFAVCMLKNRTATRFVETLFLLFLSISIGTSCLASI